MNDDNDDDDDDNDNDDDDNDNDDDDNDDDDDDNDDDDDIDNVITIETLISLCCSGSLKTDRPDISMRICYHIFISC